MFQLIEPARFVASWIASRVTKDERGASMVEYALLLALIAVVCIAAVTFLGHSASDKFTDVGNKISSAGTTATTAAP